MFKENVLSGLIKLATDTNFQDSLDVVWIVSDIAPSKRQQILEYGRGLGWHGRRERT